VRRRSIIIAPADAVAIARAAAFVPVSRRKEFVRGVVASLRGLRRPDADTVATAVLTQWRLIGVIPRKAPKPGFRPPFKRAA
jgi:hypothetical protein